MADWTDDATNQQEQELERLLQARKLAAQKHEAALKAATGKCLNCDARLPLGRYCDDGCRDDHERRLRVTPRR